MSNSSYSVRNYQPADFDKYVLLNVEPEKLARPNYRPEQDLFIVEIAGNIVGYMDVTPELSIERVILNCWVHPEHRRRGLATKLLDSAKHQAKELGARVAHVNINEKNEVAKRVLSRLGFKFARQFLEQSIDLAGVHWQEIDRAALGCRHLHHGEEDKLTRIQNRTFASNWGYNINTVEEVIYRTNLTGCSPEDIFLACDEDKVIGYCWTGITYEREAIGKGKGRIFMMGTDPAYRGRGVGKRVLMAGLAHLRSKGLSIVELTVDSENEVACSLYESIGFQVRISSLWYEKSLS